METKNENKIKDFEEENDDPFNIIKPDLVNINDIIPLPISERERERERERISEYNNR